MPLAPPSSSYGDPGGGDEDGRGGTRSAVKSGGCCAAKTISLIKPLALRVIQHPLTPARQIWLNRIDYRVTFAQRKRQPWSIDAD